MGIMGVGAESSNQPNRPPGVSSSDSELRTGCLFEALIFRTREQALQRKATTDAACPGAGRPR